MLPINVQLPTSCWCSIDFMVA